ncbi:MAG: VOC family protein [Paracoccaceae bacterium]|nr:VOC family protein [Paracoccaceae bacterium]
MEFDHIAIAGETLVEAIEHVEAALGVKLQAGGQHDVFFTHNALLGLEDWLYLEAIAIDPNAPDPDRSRWFDLDRFTGAPRLTNWICRTDDIDAALSNIPADMGRPVALQRGSLRWRMAVPENGILPFDNCAPALIQWDTKERPAKLLAQCGVRLRRLTVSHPQATVLQTVFTPHLKDDRLFYETGESGLVAEFDTPHGRRVLA